MPSVDYMFTDGAGGDSGPPQRNGFVAEGVAALPISMETLAEALRVVAGELTGPHPESVLEALGASEAGLTLLAQAIVRSWPADSPDVWPTVSGELKRSPLPSPIDDDLFDCLPVGSHPD